MIIFHRRRFLSLATSFVVLLLFLCCKFTPATELHSDKNHSALSDKDADNISAQYGTPGNHTDLLTVGMPANSSGQIKEYAGFILSFNADNHTPNWVAWELLPSETEGEAKRTKFWQDSDIIGCPEHKDYTHSGYSRGHMCPAADNHCSAEMMHDCFVMANMCPQRSELNNGAWKTLEKKCRQWAEKYSALVIVAGPVYDKSDNLRIGNTGIRVPSAFYKVILAPDAETPQAIGFIYPNMRAPGDMYQYAMSVDKVEQITGFDFFSALPEEIENAVEATFNRKQWDRY